MPRSPVSTQAFPGALSAGNLASVDSTNWLELDGFGGFVRVETAAPAGISNNFLAGSMCRHKGTYSADQYAEITVSGVSGGVTDSNGIGLRCGTDTSPNDDGYVIYLVENNSVTVARRTNGSQAALTTGTSPITGITWGTGDKLSAEVEGTGATVTIRVYRTPSGGSLTLIGTFTDTDAGRFTSGNPAILRAETGSSRITAWEAGDVTAGGTGVGSAQAGSSATAEAASYSSNPNILVMNRRQVFVTNQTVQF